MIADATEHFVYQRTSASVGGVLAGRVSVRSSGHEATGIFTFNAGYLGRADTLDLDPVELRRRQDAYTSTTSGGWFGALRDALPDAWGRHLLGHVLGIPEPSETEVMTHAPADGVGALVFSGGEEPERPVTVLQEGDLPEAMALVLLALARGADEAGPTTELLPILTALGGSRPKLTVEADGALWVAKFPRPEDRWNNPRVEHATMQLARDCGLDVAETRVVQVSGQDVLLVRRFDRRAAEVAFDRLLVVSALTMLLADEFRDERWSYPALAQIMESFAGETLAEQRVELFRRATLNALISNIDDHPRNQAFLRTGGTWRLSPAYDLVPTPMFATGRRDLAMTVGIAGRYANRANLLSECEAFGLEHADAERIVDDMAHRVRSSWRATMATAGVAEDDQERIASAFAYEGFDYVP